MTNDRSEQVRRGDHRQPGSAVGTREKQLALFPISSAEPWKLLSTRSLPLDKDRYEAICQCYREVFEAFLPGRGSKTFYAQVSEQLQAQKNVTIKPRTI